MHGRFAAIGTDTNRANKSFTARTDGARSGLVFWRRLIQSEFSYYFFKNIFGGDQPLYFLVLIMDKSHWLMESSEARKYVINWHLLRDKEWPFDKIHYGLFCIIIS